MGEKPVTERRWLSVAEAAAYVGVNRFTMYDAIASGKIPKANFGRKILVDRLTLDKLLGSGGFTKPVRKRTEPPPTSTTPA